MIKKKIVISSFLLLLYLTNVLVASEYTGYSSDNNLEMNTNSKTQVYENGFHHGINCIEREFQLYGKSGDVIRFKSYMVLMNIASLSRESILIYKNYAYEEGLVPVSIDTEKLVFKSFDRRADAEYLANKILNKKYMGNDNKVIIKHNNPNQEYRRGKFIYSEIFDKMRESMEKEVEGKVFITDGTYMSPVYSATSYAQTYPLQTYDVEPILEKKVVSKVIKTVKKKKPIKKVIKKKKRYFSIKHSKAELFKYDQDKKLISAGFIDSGIKRIYKITQKIDGVFYVRYKKFFIELDDVIRH
ncbi:MAG: Unknown protein [uncultured Sulfurovum sp.]|uniref:Uncharacterized protein n=1 Tax=uncultured Sulfurovum sp. TaxID=269237 RepID=A0A6S6SB12_9BACT|nr:MAG: Unknown protein [uncultured Sulfurovum sp.]